MEVHFTPEQEAKLAQLATEQGTDAEGVIRRLVEEWLAAGRATRTGATRQRRREAQAAAEGIRELRKGVTLERPAGMSLRDYAHIGHRY